MPRRPRNPLFIDWRNSSARAVLLQDLEPGGILYQRDNISEEEAWEFYKQLPQFDEVVWSQFQARLKDHRKQAGEQIHRAAQEEQYMIHDRQLHPRQSHNERGEPVFDMSPAKALLREDIKQKLHTTMTPAKLQASKQAYQPFKPEIFRARIYQEVRLQKYFNYLKLKRARELESSKK
jgi:hypothetical protein